MWKSIRRLLGEPVRHDPLIELEDGLEVMERLAAEVGADCKTIIMTAHGEVRSAVRAMKTGAFDYLQKPFDNDELPALIA